MKALVLHGFTGTLDTVSLLGDGLRAEGLEVSTPILRGHCTEPEHLFRVHWRDWVADARSALLELAPSEHEPVLIVGHSMGAMLACVMACEFSHRVPRMALLAPAFGFRSRLIHLLPLLKRVYRTWSGNPEYADPGLMYTNTNYPRFPVESFEQVLALAQMTEGLLPKIKCPVGTFYAKRDPIVPPSVLKLLDKKLGSGPTQRHIYKKSFHELLQDVEADQICADIIDFLLTE